MPDNDNYGIKLKIKGKYALFTRPETKVERYSYDIITPSAARGILEAIHWKPAIRWVIDEIKVLNEIKFQSIRRNEVGSKIPVNKIKSAMKNKSLDGLDLIIEDNRQQRAANVLVDVEYIISAHFEFTEKRGPEDNEGKHLDIFNRRARSGQCFHQPCLGTREFVADFELIEGIDNSTPINETRDLGLMLWDIDHKNNHAPMYFRAKLENGIVKVPQPETAEILR